MTLHKHHTQTVVVASTCIQTLLQKLEKIAVYRQYSTVGTTAQIVSHIYLTILQIAHINNQVYFLLILCIPKLK